MSANENRIRGPYTPRADAVSPATAPTARSIAAPPCDSVRQREARSLSALAIQRPWNRANLPSRARRLLGAPPASALRPRESALAEPHDACLREQVEPLGDLGQRRRCIAPGEHVA